MASFREIKRNARRLLHERMKVEVVYVHPSPAIQPIEITVRIHSKMVSHGDLEGGQYAQIHEIEPRIIFMRDQVTVRNQALVVVEPGEIYRVITVLPPDDITVTAEVVLLRADEITTRFPDGPPLPGQLNTEDEDDGDPDDDSGGGDGSDDDDDGGAGDDDDDDGGGGSGPVPDPDDP